MPSTKNYTFSYEPERKDGKYQEPEFCVWRDKSGKEVLRLSYRTILEFSRVWGVPREIADEIIFWTKMIHNPD
jgi:hypothetical protein